MSTTGTPMLSGPKTDEEIEALDHVLTRMILVLAKVAEVLEKLRGELTTANDPKLTGRIDALEEFGAALVFTSLILDDALAEARAANQPKPATEFNPITPGMSSGMLPGYPWLPPVPPG